MARYFEAQRGCFCFWNVISMRWIIPLISRYWCLSVYFWTPHSENVPVYKHSWTHVHARSHTLTLYLEWAPIAMATRAYWLIGRLYPTADVGLFCICSDLLNDGRQKKCWDPEKASRVHWDWKGTKCIKGIFKQKTDDPVLWSIVDDTRTVYKPLRECSVLTAVEKRRQQKRSKCRELWQIKIIFGAHYFYVMARKGISKHLRPTLTFQLEREAETSTGPPRGQRSVCSWSCSSPLEEWSSQWWDTCINKAKTHAKLSLKVGWERLTLCVNPRSACLF